MSWANLKSMRKMLFMFFIDIIVRLNTVYGSIFAIYTVGP